jgi:hypothetical protein
MHLHIASAPPGLLGLFLECMVVTTGTDAIEKTTDTLYVSCSMPGVWKLAADGVHSRLAAG